MTPLSKPRRRAWRAVLSALAGGGLTAASFGGPFSAGALGASARTRTGASRSAAPIPVAVTESGTGAQGTGAQGTGSGQPTTTSSTPPPTPLTVPQASTPAPTTTGPAAPEAPTVVVQHGQKTTPAKTASPTVSAVHAQPSTTATGTKGPTSPANNNVAPAPQLVAAQAGALAAELAGSAASVQALSYYRIPLFLLPIYQAASAQYGVPWQILAAINEVETNYGSDLSVSTAGAVGWMQFMPATWIQYGVDALNAGYADPYNPVDAIFAAARYLKAAGASSDLRAAILAYNHSAEYVSSVLLRARLISKYPNAVIATLTGLTDGRLPVRDGRVAWSSIAPLATVSSATGHATAAPSVASAGGAGASGKSALPGSSAPPSPTAVAAAAAGAGGASGQALQLVDLQSAPNVTVVAAQDGRVVKLGSSRTLGRYVVLRDVYGDVFTYAGLGSIASTYRLPKPPRSTGVSGKAAATAGVAGREPAPTQPASAGRQLPLTLSVKTPSRKSATGNGLTGAGADESAGAKRSIPAGPAGSAVSATGKVRLFAHPDNPDAVGSTAGAAKRANRRAASTDRPLPLRTGSVVAKGTVLGHVRTPVGARAGHLRFAIRPAGDQSTIDPRPILQNWEQLAAALHPQGVRGETNLLGATASGVFLLSKAELEREVLSDPGIDMYACGRHDIASGAIDRRVLAVLAFLSRSGLKPTVSALRCGHSEFTVSGYVSEHYAGDAVDISAIDGVPIAGHQGPGTVTDTTIRTLLTLQGEFVPHQIISLMQYPGAPNTLAMPEHWDHIHVGFRAVGAAATLSSPAGAATAHSARAGHAAPAPLLVGADLSSSQWSQLITHIAALPAPKVAVRPGAAAIRDPKRP
jgi:soluble lytic murein transglycosylase-like protein